MLLASLVLIVPSNYAYLIYKASPVFLGTISGVTGPLNSLGESGFL